MALSRFRAIVTWSIVLVTLPGVLAQAPPPASVNVGAVAEGKLAPTAVRKGTVYFKEVSNLATEVNGIVKEVLFEEGQHVKAGAPLVRLDYSLLEAELDAARALALQSGANLSQEQARLERAKSLLEDEVTTPQEYDDIRFTVESTAHRVEAAKAEVERITREIAKKTIYAPFSGVVIDRVSEVGDWKREGDPIAVFARDDEFDVIVNLPEENLPWIPTGLELSMRIAGKELGGRVVAIVPRGDVATRQFPVKVRVTGQDWLLESMTADVHVPIGAAEACLVVPRDAVIMDAGQNLLFLVKDGKASRVAVTVLGYDGNLAGVKGEGIAAGLPVVVKGQERLRDGQSVAVLPEGSAS